MFRNRSLVVTPVKTADLEPQEETREEFSLDARAAVFTNNVVQGVGMLIATYMASDTIRKCIIHTVETRVK